ncbi:hypothetical protein CCR75_006930 [Bremia lactucae]|uniref:Uncharacterized protein n=1 Tax=Bremia lactucae TaxID=4779 RepID=A0A976ICV8_BRELC|nr:hypothetical protein CCR75_006930 [Bremia lactucae]
MNPRNILMARDAINWRLWCRDTYVLPQALTCFQSSNGNFAQALVELKKKERSQLKETMQILKSSSHANKNTRRLQLDCYTALSKAELAEKLQIVDTSIKRQASNQFGLNKRAKQSLQKLSTQLASGIDLLRDMRAF